MRVGLIQIDGKWANLALMKISAWHKKQGDKVEWYQPLFEPYDQVYASKIFSYTPDNEYLRRGTIKGGSGYDLQAKLPDEIEQMFPDYSIYPNVDYAIGFTTRGCPRKCPFCIVPQKEGNLKVVGDIYDFWNGQKQIRLLDANLTAAPLEHFEKIIGQLEREKIKAEFSQGLDLRFLRKEHCLALQRVLFMKRIYFAWDCLKDEESIIKGLTLFLKYFHPDRVMVYVLIGYDTTPAEDLHRVLRLKKMGVNPYVMKFGRGNSYQASFARWVNRPEIFKSAAWEDYKRKKAERN